MPTPLKSTLRLTAAQVLWANFHRRPITADDGPDPINNFGAKQQEAAGHSRMQRWMDDYNAAFGRYPVATLEVDLE